MLNILKTEEFTYLKQGRQWERILSGDSVEVTRRPFMTSKDVETFRGLVIAVVNKASDSRLTVINVSMIFLCVDHHQYFSLYI